jgi:cyclase
MKARIRVIPVLLVKGNGLYKTIKFKDARYVGDPINAIRIFNEKEVDELCVLDITAGADGSGPNMKLIEEFASECFMPVCYGGGITTFEHARDIFKLGIEKIALNTAAVLQPDLVARISESYGASSVVVSVDYKSNLFGKAQVHIQNGQQNTKRDVVEHARAMEAAGAGELLLNSISRDGTGEGYDLEVLKRVSEAVSIPVIACGGAGTLDHLRRAVREGGASAVSAGSMFVFHGKLRGVLINFPSPADLKSLFS